MKTKIRIKDVDSYTKSQLTEPQLLEAFRNKTKILLIKHLIMVSTLGLIDAKRLIDDNWSEEGIISLFKPFMSAIWDFPIHIDQSYSLKNAVCHVIDNAQVLGFRNYKEAVISILKNFNEENLVTRYEDGQEIEIKERKDNACSGGGEVVFCP